MPEETENAPVLHSASPVTLSEVKLQAHPRKRLSHVCGHQGQGSRVFSQEDQVIRKRKVRDQIVQIQIEPRPFLVLLSREFLRDHVEDHYEEERAQRRALTHTPSDGHLPRHDTSVQPESASEVLVTLNHGADEILGDTVRAKGLSMAAWNTLSKAFETSSFKQTSFLPHSLHFPARVDRMCTGPVKLRPAMKACCHSERFGVTYCWSLASRTEPQVFASVGQIVIGLKSFQISRDPVLGSKIASSSVQQEGRGREASASKRSRSSANLTIPSRGRACNISETTLSRAHVFPLFMRAMTSLTSSAVIVVTRELCAAEVVLCAGGPGRPLGKPAAGEPSWPPEGQSAGRGVCAEGVLCRPLEEPAAGKGVCSEGAPCGSGASRLLEGGLALRASRGPGPAG